MKLLNVRFTRRDTVYLNTPYGVMNKREMLMHINENWCNDKYKDFVPSAYDRVETEYEMRQMYKDCEVVIYRGVSLTEPSDCFYEVFHYMTQPLNDEPEIIHGDLEDEDVNETDGCACLKGSFFDPKMHVRKLDAYEEFYPTDALMVLKAWFCRDMNNVVDVLRTAYRISDPNELLRIVTLCAQR